MNKASVRAILNRPATAPLPGDWTGLLRLLDRALTEASKDFAKESGQ